MALFHYFHLSSIRKYLTHVVDSWVEKPMYKYLRDDLEGVQHVGLETQPNLEEISKLNPDLIVAVSCIYQLMPVH